MTLGPKCFFRENIVDFQLCPPNDHHTNQTEKSINTWKCHFLSGLSGVYPNFPLHLWCRLLPQVTQTLNLLRRSRINPRLFMEDHLNGAFEYNWNSMAPPGTEVLIHETPQQQHTWELHGKEGWHIGTPPLQYQRYGIYIPETRGERITKTVHFPLHNSTMPDMSSANAATYAARLLADAL